MYKLEIFCQPAQKAQVLSTLHESGVDKIGDYDHCWAFGAMTGSHRALEGAKPVFGDKGLVENYDLLKIEINVDKAQVKPIVEQLKLCLGWEEPLVNVLKLHNAEFDL
ncbi:cation tolerance protein CutA [Vibrio coralliilyticus]|uniref:Cation tolerance protein CutA n=1 Tax=Vibrio coralliilyticus TaxID=190893 RepID=A0A837G531_9VIBR|nr:MULTISPECIES: hypothetical protein [Vibrio]EEX30879.1 cutA-like protein divalent cations tolerance CutA family [Vibrio coralliilyticus ATCC BAA-450]KJY79244.1 cation tolerance protein CutA [Vibrio coralliilyticus]MCM5507506.1 hypothetical protein [Vibrio sp. SCSIO 43169]MDE3896079.1 hypothetical protein [Vibrio sp. CC007]NRF63668.1 hypothetical protein [Vibrio coralliilyticus]